MKFSPYHADASGDDPDPPNEFEMKNLLKKLNSLGKHYIPPDMLFKRMH